jgi:hypothetical protein
MIEHLTLPSTAAARFQSAAPSIVKSVKQLDLLNIWLRAFAKRRALPCLKDYKPDRIADELPDLMTFEVVGEGDHARFFITHEGTRLTSVYGSEHIEPDKRINRYLEDAVGPVRYRRVVPFYRACLATGRPAYSISMVRDADGKEVSYERLLLPFGGATAIDHIVGSLQGHQHRGRLQHQGPDEREGRSRARQRDQRSHRPRNCPRQSERSHRRRSRIQLAPRRLAIHDSGTVHLGLLEAASACSFIILAEMCRPNFAIA